MSIILPTFARAHLQIKPSTNVFTCNLITKRKTEKMIAFVYKMKKNIDIQIHHLTSYSLFI